MTLKEIEDAMRLRAPDGMVIIDAIPLGVVITACADALAAERERIEAQQEAWVRYKRGIDEALNSGIGVYKP